MWIWDTMPSGGYHAKKPLTKAQVRKMQEAYKNADKISAEVKAKEEQEQSATSKETENMLQLLSL